MNEDELIFIPNINEEEYDNKSEKDHIILKEREEERKKIEAEYLATIGRDTRLYDVAQVIENLFTLFIEAYRGILDENFDLLETNLKEILNIVENKYNERCSAYAVYVWDVWMIEMYFCDKNIDDISSYIEKALASIYEFSKEKYEINLSNDLLSEDDFKSLTETLLL